MMSIIAHFWYWFLAVLAIGVVTALRIHEVEAKGKVSAWLIWAGLAFLAGLVAAALHVFFGRADVWLETALLSFVSYLAGAAIGGLFGARRDLREHKGWALGLIPAGLVWLVANFASVPGLEADIKDKALAALKEIGADAQKIEVSGRDVLVGAGASAGEAAGALEKLAKVSGVRLVSTVEKVAGEMADMSGKAMTGVEKTAKEATDAAKAEADRLAEAAKAAADKAALDKTVDAGKAATGKAAELGASGADHAVLSADKAKAILAALPAAGALDAATCQGALSATVALEKIQFRTASATIRLASANVLDKLAAILKRCPEVKVEIGGYTDNVGDDEDNDALSQRRADSVLKYLVREGVAAGRLSSKGYGAKAPIASNDTEDGRAENRRIEFVAK